MFKRYKISLDTIESFIGDFIGDNMQTIHNSNAYKNWVRDQYAAYGGDCLHSAIYGKDGVIKAQMFSDDQFPIQKRHVFISHASKDADVAKVFAYILSKFGVTCFIDSMIWNNISVLQSELDKRYCWLVKDKLFDYKKRNNSTAHVHTMLSSALFEMIDACECCVFIESHNSEIRLNDIGGTSTFSPWIFSEINFINKIRVNPPERHKSTRTYSGGGRINESEEIKIAYPLRSIDDMEVITDGILQELFSGVASSDSGEQVLDRLYEICKRVYS